MDNKLYALALIARKLEGNVETVATEAAATTAKSKYEAVGIGIQMAQNNFPVSEWFGHTAVVCEIPPELMKKILASQEQES